MKSKKVLAPPWLACPNIERYSIGWRMGCGEDYILNWALWYEELDTEDTAEYQKLFPEPTTWKGYWKDNDESEYYENGDLCIGLWRSNGKPKYSLKQLKQDYCDGKKLDYIMFWGHQPAVDGHLTNSCLSQWWKSKFWSNVDNYCCMEQYMMAKKAELFCDKDILQQILSCEEPKQIKLLGCKIKNFNEEVWNEVKYTIVLYGSFMKFTQNADLKEFLLSTGNSILVEASPFDGIWGIKMRESDENARNPMKWRGENLLGFALMEVRDEIRKVCQHEDLCETISE